MKSLKMFFIVCVIFCLINCSKETTKPETEIPTYEQTGTIDENGGIVQITDNNSPLNGSYVSIQEGALNSEVTISINPAVETYSFEGDSTKTFVSFEPDGIQFNEPVEIGIPYDEAVNPYNLLVYFYDEDELVWKSLPTLSVDTENQIITAETNHFCVITGAETGIQFDINLYQSDDKIAANIKLLTPLQEMPLSRIGMLASGFTNICDLIEDRPFDVKAYFSVALREKVIGFDPILETKRIFWGILSEQITPIYEVRAQDEEGNPLFQTNNAQLYLYDEFQDYFSGEPLLFRFDETIPESGKEYYIEYNLYYLESWYFYSLEVWCGFNVNSLDYDYYLEYNEMNPAPDEDNDLLIDLYDDTIGNPPTVTISAPEDESEYLESETIYFSGSGSDQEDGNLTGSSLVWTSNQEVDPIGTGNSFNLNDLSVNTHIITLTATDSDENIGSDNITIYVFSEQNDPPNLPSNPFPNDGATSVSIYTHLSWECTDPNGDPLTYDVHFGPPLVISSQSSTTYDPGTLNEETTYYWKIVAYDDHSNSTTGDIWQFTTAGSGNQPPNPPTNPNPADNATSILQMQIYPGNVQIPMVTL